MNHNGTIDDGRWQELRENVHLENGFYPLRLTLHASMFPKCESSAEQNRCRQTNAFTECTYVCVADHTSHTLDAQKRAKVKRENSIRTIVIPFFRITGPYQLFTLNKHAHTNSDTLTVHAHKHLLPAAHAFGQTRRWWWWWWCWWRCIRYMLAHYLLKVKYCRSFSLRLSLSPTRSVFKWNDKHKYRTKNKPAVYLVWLIYVILFFSKCDGQRLRILHSPSLSLCLPSCGTHRMEFSIENHTDQQWIFRTKFCGLSKLKFDTHFVDDGCRGRKTVGGRPEGKTATAMAGGLQLWSEGGKTSRGFNKLSF